MDGRYVRTSLSSKVYHSKAFLNEQLVIAVVFNKHILFTIEFRLS